VTKTSDAGVADRAKTLHSRGLELEIAAGPTDNGRERLIVRRLSKSWPASARSRGASGRPPIAVYVVSRYVRNWWHPMVRRITKSKKSRTLSDT
jgi:hypothetical protein